jgi:hypothetical protein
MASFTRTNGSVVPGVEFVGRDLQFFTINKTDITAVQMEAIIFAVETVASVEAIGAATYGTSDTVNIIISGTSKDATALTALADAAVSGATITAMSF